MNFNFFQASSAAEGLCKWIIAMDAYDAVAKNVAPKKAKLAQAEREYAETMSILTEKRELAAILEKRVAELNENLEIANAKKKKVEDEVEMCITKLKRAEKLLGSLGGEKSRWIEAAENLQLIYDSLPGDLLVSCGIIAYLAPFTAQYRTKCVSDWHTYCKTERISCSEDFSFVTVLGSEIKVRLAILVSKN
jgi:dynein heavy chain, axonemal